MEWIPAPRYKFRVRLVEKLVKRLPKGRYLEVGIGGGDLMLRLSKLGLSGKGIDFSDRSIKEAKERLIGVSGIEIEKKNFMDMEEKFDMVFMFEVLEHIREDMVALRKLNSLINDNGYMFISVPCHQHKWGSNDVYAGHIRRYEKSELMTKLKDSGFVIKEFWSYGYPFINMIKPIRDQMVAKRLKDVNYTLQEKTEKSGVEREYQKKWKFFFHDFFLWPFYLMQELFLNSDLGNGYLVLVKKEKLDTISNE